MIRALQASLYYIAWHYTRALKDYARLWLTFFWFVYNFFSISILVGSIFSPWRRMGEAYGHGFNADAFFAALIINTLMRVVGFCVRIVVIIAGAFSLAAVLFLGCAGFIVWLALPLIIGLFFFLGVGLVISASFNFTF